SGGCLVFCPPQENVARCLHGTLTFDDPPAGVAAEFRSKAFEHRFPRFFDLQEQRGTIVAHKQPDGAERADASNSDCFEGRIPEKVPLEQTQYFWRKSFFIGAKNAFGVNSVPWIVLSCEMINHRRLVGDVNLFSLYEMRKVVIVFQPFARLGQDGMELSPQLS